MQGGQRQGGGIKPVRAPQLWSWGAKLWLHSVCLDLTCQMGMILFV